MKRLYPITPQLVLLKKYVNNVLITIGTGFDVDTYKNTLNFRSVVPCGITKPCLQFQHGSQARDDNPAYGAQQH